MYSGRWVTEFGPLPFSSATCLATSSTRFDSDEGGGRGGPFAGGWPCVVAGAGGLAAFTSIPPPSVADAFAGVTGSGAGVVVAAAAGLAAFSTAGLAAFSTAGLDAVSTAGLAAFSTTGLAAFSTAGLAAFSTDVGAACPTGPGAFAGCAGVAIASCCEG